MLPVSKARVLWKGRERILAPVDFSCISNSSFIVNNTVAHPSVLTSDSFYLGGRAGVGVALSWFPELSFQEPSTQVKIIQKVYIQVFIWAISASLQGDTYYYSLAQKHIFIVFAPGKHLVATIEACSNYVKGEFGVWKQVTRTSDEMGHDNRDALVIQGSISCLHRFR